MFLKQRVILFPFVLVQPETVSAHEDVAVVREKGWQLFSLKEQVVVGEDIVHDQIPRIKQSNFTHGGMSQRLIGIQEV